MTPAQQIAIAEAVLNLHAALHDADESISLKFCDALGLSEDPSAAVIATRTFNMIEDFLP
jgi:hypothetical protein